MVGDQTDIVRRIKATLPVGWFPDESPVLDGLLSGIGQAWSWIYGWIDYAEKQARLGTASDIWLDLVANDYFGPRLLRYQREADDHFRSRVTREFLRERATRVGLVSALTDLTGRVPDVFEPTRCRDTGAYGVSPGTTGGLAYNLAGGWGSLSLPYQCFITAYRPVGSGIALVAGWNRGGGGYGVGAMEYANLALMEDQISDAEIYAAVSATMPVATIGWTRITD